MVFMLGLTTLLILNWVSLLVDNYLLICLQEPNETAIINSRIHYHVGKVKYCS
jgi:hypothetical protein